MAFEATGPRLRLPEYLWSAIHFAMSDPLTPTLNPTTTRGVIGTGNISYVGFPHQWVCEGSAAPAGTTNFTVVAVVTASYAVVAPGQMAIVSTIEGSPVNAGGFYFRYTQGVLRYSTFNDQGGAAAEVSVSLTQTQRCVVAAVHCPSSNYVALHLNGPMVNSSANPARWVRQGSMGIGVRHANATPLQPFSGGIEQLYILSRALSAGELSRLMGLL